MQNILSYLVESIACAGIFAAYYRCFLHNGRFFRYNRAYLLSAAMLSLIFPLIHITFYVNTPAVREEVEIFVYATEEISLVDRPERFDYTPFCWILYLLPVVLVFVIELKNFLKIKAMKRNFPSAKINGINVYNVDAEEAPFSFFNAIFWKSNMDINSSDGQRIFLHELAHVKAGHSYDKLLIQLLCTVFWMNPVLRIFKRELTMVHEYAADNACIADNNTEELSALILCSLYPNGYLGFANRFFQSSIKKRIIMMTKSKKSKFSLFRKTMIVPVIFAMLYVFAVDIEARTVPVPGTEPVSIPVSVPEPAPMPEPIPAPVPVPQDKTVVPFAIVEVKPKFNGNHAIGFINWINEQIEKDGYPAEAFEKNIQGTVYLSFTIKSDGLLSDIKSTRKVDLILANKAIEIVKKSPKWEPGLHKGKAVDVPYMVYVVFKIADKNQKAPDSKTIDAQLKGKVKEISSEDGGNLNSMLPELKGNVKKISTEDGGNLNSMLPDICPENSYTGEITYGNLDSMQPDSLVPKKKFQTASFRATYLRNAKEANGKNPIVILDGKPISSTEEFSKIEPHAIKSFSIIKSDEATEKFGEDGKNGVVIINLKNADEINSDAERTTIPSADLRGDESLKIMFSSTKNKSFDETWTPVIIAGGKHISTSELNDLDVKKVQSITIYKSEKAVEVFGEQGKSGAVVVELKNPDEANLDSGNENIYRYINLDDLKKAIEQQKSGDVTTIYLTGTTEKSLVVGTSFATKEK